MDLIGIPLRKWLRRKLAKRRFEKHALGERGDSPKILSLKSLAKLLLAAAFFFGCYGVLYSYHSNKELLTPQLSSTDKYSINATDDISLYSPDKIAAQLQAGGGFNLEVSNVLPLIRTVSDFRDEACMSIEYDLDILPQATVVIIFHNEPFSTLMRTVESVVNGTPPKLLKEVILVDDASTDEHIREGGNDKVLLYIAKFSHVRLLRNPERKGIVGARLLGIRSATAPVVVILDSHIEVQAGWLEPLCQRLMEKPNAVLLPMIDHIDPVTFKEGKGGIGCFLGFLWKLVEHGDERWHEENLNILGQHEEGEITPVKSPAMAGGIFAVNKEFFVAIGEYDEGFYCWGAENLEFSFRVWMCGGEIECIPCSRVFHIFRQGGFAYKCPPTANTINKMRTLMWMDEYATLAWHVIGRPTLDYGEKSLQERRELRKKLECRSFDWYLKNVFPGGDIQSLSDVPYLGRVINRGTSHCLHWVQESPGSHVTLERCDYMDQFIFMYFSKREYVHPVFNDEACLHADGSFDWCSHSSRDKWEYDKDGHLINEGLCLTDENMQLEMRRCSDSIYQKWDWTEFHPPEKFNYPEIPNLRSFPPW